MTVSISSLTPTGRCSAIVELDTQNQAIDFLTVAEALSKSVGSGASEIGVPFLVELTEKCPITENVEHYATIVRKYHYLRRIITACQETSRRAITNSGEVTDFLEEIEREFLDITTNKAQKVD